MSFARITNALLLGIIAGSVWSGCGTDTETVREVKVVEVSGLDGTDCTLEELPEGVLITCGEKSALVRHGKDGADGKDGAEGKDSEPKPTTPCKKKGDGE